jgi:catechol 2,3-dioxygenase-like lactoylglutathione lyase family enzyme
MLPAKLDHCVIHVTDWERSNAFYTTVLGAELVARPAGYAYRFGDKQLNVHGPGVKPAEVARLPVAPGNSDLCFEWQGPIADAIAHLGRCGVRIESGPMQRFGARGAGTSVYFRDPDGSLMEFMSYAGEKMVEAPGMHDPNILPPDLPAPQDDGRARHLTGLKLPDVALRATGGGMVNLSRLKGRTVVYVYGIKSPARAAARRNRAAFAIISPSSRRSASPRFLACRRKTPAISRRQRIACICRFRSSPMPI